MKKFNYGLFVNISMMALLVCSIIFGVYSAKNATLNVSGVIGFTAHNIDVKYTASISGAYSNDYLTPVTNKNVNSEQSISTPWNTGALYFSDLASDIPEQIVLQITLYNYSPYAVSCAVRQTQTPNGVFSYNVEYGEGFIKNTDEIMVINKATTTSSNATFNIVLSLTGSNVSSEVNWAFAFNVQLSKCDNVNPSSNDLEGSIVVDWRDEAGNVLRSDEVFQLSAVTTEMRENILEHLAGDDFMMSLQQREYYDIMYFNVTERFNGSELLFPLYITYKGVQSWSNNELEIFGFAEFSYDGLSYPLTLSQVTVLSEYGVVSPEIIVFIAKVASN